MVVPNTTSAMRHLQIFYDQVYSISYFGTPMMPLWRHLYGNISGIVQKTDYGTITDVCLSKLLLWLVNFDMNSTDV